MKNTVFKRIFAAVLIIVLLGMLLASTVLMAYGDNTYIIGTNEALGSPLLDSNFTYEEWNKWEMVVWGIFLSNFTVPLIDDYRSAFVTDSTSGSKGAGYKALKFSTGSDSAAEEVVQNLLSYAIKQQQSGAVKEIFVQYNNVQRDKIVKDDTSEVRQATFRDLFMGESESSPGNTWVQQEDYEGITAAKNPVVVEGTAIKRSTTLATSVYMDIVTANSGCIPTFLVGRKIGDSYETIFDYTNSWDIQVMTAWFSRTVCGDYKKEFAEMFERCWEDDRNLYLDCFGNICIYYDGSYRIVIPASINQHLTATPKINLLSSLIFDGYNSGTSEENLILQGRQSISGWFGTRLFSDIRYGGLPAFGSYKSSIDEGSIYFYYDTDTLSYQTHFNGGALSTGKTVSTESGYNMAESAYEVDYGKVVKKLFDLDIDSDKTSDFTFKIEAAGMENIKLSSLFSNKDAQKALEQLIVSSGQLVNIIGYTQKADVLTTVKTINGEINLFDDPIIIPVQMEEGGNSSNINSTGIARRYINYLYKVYTGEAGDNTIRNDVVNILNNSKDVSDFRKQALNIGDKKINALLASFITDDYNKKYITPLFSKDELMYTSYTSDNIFNALGNVKVGERQAVGLRYNTSGNLDYFGCRLIKAYPISNAMRTVSNYLGIRDGTDFAVWASYIYMTYLKWYGVEFNYLTGEMRSDLNTNIYDDSQDILNVDITKLVKTTSKEEKEKSILDYTYLMLHPSEGREYRKEILSRAFTDWLYETYNKIVYGDANTFYSSISSDVATRSSGGFLNVDTYSENFMTAWFVKIYAKIAIALIGIAFVIITITGMIKGHKISWFLVAMAIVINAILVVPSIGDVTPTVLNNMVQKMFSDKMTYWAVSESVENIRLEKDYISDNDVGKTGLTGKELTDVIDAIKSLNILYLDRSLMIKKDISSKVTETADSNYTEIQSLKSARWLLPIVMSQISADDGSANYVYVTLGDLYDDLSNMYWYYNPIDATVSGTINGYKQCDVVGTPLTSTARKLRFMDYIDTSTDTGNHRSIAYERNSYNLKDMPHTYFYLLDGIDSLPTRSVGFGGEYTGRESFDNYIAACLNRNSLQNDMLKVANVLETEAGRYNSSDRNTMQECYGYLWATENPYHYFYQVIKDSFSYDITLGALIGDIQGQYVMNIDTGEEVRKNFMYADETGYVRDVLDLEEMFTNMLPYLYQMQLASGGYSGKNGVLGDKKIDNYDIYRNNYKSWLFRSNWATKLMESRDYTSKCIVRDSSGTAYDVLNPMLPECYPDSRPMVFSEAQMHALGLHEADLSIVELKCIAINKAVTKRWTMLLNYSGVAGITKEVIYRQMATEAILEFNNELSSSGILDAAYILYPNGIDIRSISFDSVMRMLLLNVTRDTTYIYGDTIKNLLGNSDIFTATLLLIAAFLCSYIIPFIRNVVLGLIFFMGFVSVFYTLLSSAKQKIKTSCGFIISNVLVLVITIGYYLIFGALMAVTTNDSVLTTNSVQVSVGNPVWCLIVIIAVSIVYVICLLKMMDFCFRNYRDMGFEVFVTFANSVTDRISNTINDLARRENTSSTEYVAGTDESADSNDIDSDDETTSRQQSFDESASGMTSETTEDAGAESKIDEEIQKGKEMDN